MPDTVTASRSGPVSTFEGTADAGAVIKVNRQPSVHRPTTNAYA